MSDLPTSWRSTALGSLAEFVMGQAPPGEASNFEGIGTPFVKAGEFGLDRPIIREWTTRPLKFAKASDVLICVVGATAGKINLGADCSIGRSVAAIRPSDGLDQRLLYRFLQTQVSILRGGAVGSAQGVISRETLANIDFPLPPLAEQRRIVAKLDALDASAKRARADLDRIPALVARAKQAILAKEVESTTPDGLSRKTVAIRDVIEDLRYGTAKKCDYGSGATAVLRIPNIQSSGIDLTDLKRADFDRSELEKLALRAGDVLVIRSNGSVDLVGRCAVVSDEAIGLAFAGYLIRIRPNLRKLDPNFLRYSMAAPTTRNRITLMAKSTSGVHNINSEQLRSLAIALPSLHDQQEIVRRIEAAFARIDRIAADATSARKLLDRLDQAILAKAFRGELVPQDPNDEPADVMLTRIRAERQTEGSSPKGGRGRNPNGSREHVMKEQSVSPRDRLLKDSEKWPAVGLPFEAIARRNGMPPDQLRDAIFELLSGPSPALRQRFDEDAEVIVIQRASA